MLQKTRQRPSEIDNSDLVLNGVDGDSDELDLVRSLMEGYDYVLVPEDVWKKLIEWSVLVFSLIDDPTQNWVFMQCLHN